MLKEHNTSTWHVNHSTHEFIFVAEYDDKIPEDRRYAQATPNGRVALTVDNTSVIEYWASQIGKKFYLEFTPENADGT